MTLEGVSKCVSKQSFGPKEAKTRGSPGSLTLTVLREDVDAGRGVDSSSSSTLRLAKLCTVLGSDAEGT